MNEPPVGTIALRMGAYRIATAPHVRLMLKRIFPGAKDRDGEIVIERSADSTETLRWVMGRWPHTTSAGLLEAMNARVHANRTARVEASEILTGRKRIPTPRGWNKAMPLRDYQLQAVALSQLQAGLLIGDDIGLGKTATAIGCISEGELPALIVAEKHVLQQWADQIALFCPTLTTHIIAKRDRYRMPAHDVTIASYHTFSGWADRMEWSTVVYDEVQSLRHPGTVKYIAAQKIATATAKRIGLSATPIYNYAGEIYSVVDVLAPGALGNASEFAAEWGEGPKRRIKDPEALRSFLISQNLFVRRTRKDVGRELPPIQVVNHVVPHNPSVIDRLRSVADGLAEKVLSGGFHEKGEAARQLDIMLREATGMAKAPFVADFVQELVDAGNKVLLAGWHRNVYDIWMREFRTKAIPAVMFTGSESTAAKQRAVAAFKGKEAAVLMMSLRSGAGLDGLQHVCDTVVIGELDWSPAVIKQLIGRVARDGQKNQVTAFQLLADCGSDPVVSAVLAEKYQSAIAITDPDLLSAEPPPSTDSRIAALARRWLNIHSE